MTDTSPESRPTHWEVVETDAEQPFHVRLVAANGATILVSEKYADERDAANAIRLARHTDPAVASLYVDERKK